MKKINVLQLVDSFGIGGAEKKLKELIAHMDSDRFQTTICNVGSGEKILDYFSDLGWPVVPIYRRHRLDPGPVWRLARLIRQNRIDVIMTTLFYADFLGALVGKWAGARAVFSWETISSPEWLYARRLYPYRAVIRNIDKVISVSRATERWLVQNRNVPERMITVIPYGVNLKMYQRNAGRLRQKLAISPEDPVIGMVCRLHPQKGHIYLIKAAQRVVEQFPNAHFVLAGTGPLEQELRQIVAENGLDSCFHFLGFCDDVVSVYSICDIFTLPSLYEGLPNVVLEAMAAANPIVATPVDGTKEAVIDGETGVLVPVRSPQKLAQALISLLENPKRSREMGAKGRKRVEEHFSLQGQVKQFQDLYESHVRNDEPSSS